MKHFGLAGRRTRGVCLRCAVIIGAAGLGGCAVAPKERLLGPVQQKLNAAAFDEVWTTIRDTHWDPDLGGLDWDALGNQYRSRAASAKTMSQARSAMSGLIAELKQTHFAVIPAELQEGSEKDDSEPGESGGRLDGGTGIDVRVLDGQALVTAVAKGSPADLLGVKTGWVIVRLGGKEVAPRLARVRKRLPEDSTLIDMGLARTVLNRMYGRVGEAIEIEFLDGQDRTVVHNLERAPRHGKKVHLGSLPAFYVWFESRRIGDNIGYIAFNGFMDPLMVMGGFNKAIKGFMDADGVILDLRGNPGGIGGMAMGVAGWFVSEESQYLGTMKMRTSELKFVVNPRATTYSGRLVVLVDGLSGSTAEIFAGGMKDLGRATLVGSRTAGAALPAHMKDLSNGDALLHAIANYISRGGEVLEAKGVVPHIEVRPTREALLAGRDLALEKAIAVINAKSSATQAQVGSNN